MNKEPNPTTMRLSEVYHEKIAFLRDALGIKTDTEIVRRAIDKLYETIKEFERIKK